MKIVSRRKPSTDSLLNIPCGDCFDMSDGVTRMVIQLSEEFPAKSSGILTVEIKTGLLQYFSSTKIVRPVHAELHVF